MTVSSYHICAAGETFDSLALGLWGDEKYASELLSANPELSDKLYFDGGEILWVPDIELPADDGGEEYAPANAPWKG